MSAPAQVPPELLEKLRRLLAMTVARGCSENEATIAFRMANSIMEQYGLSKESVEMSSDGKIRPEQVTVIKTAAQSGIMPWEKKLPRVLRYLLAVESLLDLNTRGAYSIQFIGLPSDAAVAREVYRILRDEIWTASRVEKVGVLRRSFAEGCVDVLNKRAWELKKAREQAERPQSLATADAGRALVVVKQNQITEIVKKRFPGVPVSIRGSSVVGESYQRGGAFGQKMNLDFGHALGGSK